MTIKRHHLTAATVLACALLTAQRGFAQQQERWEVTLAPLYFWAPQVSGEITARGATVPVSVDFADVVKNLAGAFSLHVEARKGRWGGFGDVMFMRLSSDSTYTIPNAAGNGTRTIEGTLQLDSVIFEGGASLLLDERHQISAIGGLRTFTLSPKMTLTGASVQVTPIDASHTSADGFVGLTLRPALTPKLRVISRADVGGGTADLTWNALLGVEYRFTPRFSLAVGYKGYGIKVADDTMRQVRGYDLTQYGPIFGLDLHWGGK